MNRIVEILIAMLLTAALPVAAQQTSVFTVFGEVFQTDGSTYAPDGTLMTVTNLTTSVSIATDVGASETGKYSATFLDFSSNRAAAVGDQIQIRARSTSGQLLGCPDDYTVTADDIGAKQVRQDVTLTNAGTIAFASSGPPSWTYRLTWECGYVTEWRYLGAGITGALVVGSAAEAGWVVTSQTSTEVVFSAGGDPLSADSLEGFRIIGTAGGMGEWRVHSSSGAIDGSLPVRLSVFSARVDGEIAHPGIVLSWRTESEVNNLAFLIYRSTQNDGGFQRVTQLPGAGSSASPREYEFTDADVTPGTTYYYYLEDVDILGNSTRSAILEITIPAAWVQTYPRVPSRTQLLPNYPNPFNPETWIPFQLAEETEVAIRIYDSRGNLIRTLPQGTRSAGSYIDPSRSVHWDGQDDSGISVASGVYFYQLKAGNFTAMRKMTIVR